VSAFDDEFGLFSEATVDDTERAEPRRAQPEPRAEPRTEARPEPRYEARPAPARRPQREPRQNSRSAGDPWVGHRRASELLDFLARKLVQKPESVKVELFLDEDAQPVIELVVDPEDLGKVIGRNGRVAQALRTIVRAAAEGRVSVDILDTDEAATEGDGEDDAG